MRRRSIAGLILAALLLVGCWDRREVEDSAFVASIGIDAAGGDEYIWTFRVAEAEKLTMGMLTAITGQPTGLASGVIAVRARSLQQALQLVQPSISRVVSLEHVRFIALGEELARQGLAPVLSQLLRHNQIRRGASVYAVPGTALAPFLKNRPVADVNPMKFFEGIRMVQKRFHMGPPSQLHHLYARLTAPGVDPMIGVVAINDMVAEPHDAALPSMDNRSLKAGEFPRHGGNNVEFAGAGIFRGDKLTGFLNVDETTALLALRGEMGKVYMSVHDPLEEGVVVTLRLHQENKPRLRVSFQGNRPVVHAQLQLEAELLSTPGKTDYSQPVHRRKLEQHIATVYARGLFASIVQKVYHEWGADPVGFGQLFRNRFATFDDWMTYRWSDRVRDLQITVEPDVYVRRFGMLLSSEVSEE